MNNVKSHHINKMKKTFLISLLALLGMAQTVAQDYEYVPFVREGVQWVYLYNYDESSYVLHPDYTYGRHYFKLELKGDTVINGKTYKAMHKYSGRSINWENDTVPVFLREEDKIVYGIIPDGRKFADCPIGNEFAQTEFYNGQEFVLYDFADPVSFWENNLTAPNSYPFLIFMGVDTIQLGDKYVQSYKWRYSAQFCQIEGVGVDMFFNGYTLYPYMEDYILPNCKLYFHLSHLIENGKIIYRGHYYNESFVGDINGDEIISIADVTSLIDYLLTCNDMNMVTYDVNMDGYINIADVTIIIDLLLANDESAINLHDHSNNPTRNETVNDKPYVYYKNEIHRVIIDGNSTVDHYDVVITSILSSDILISSQVNGNIGTIDVSSLPQGEYVITINSPSGNIYKGIFTIH